MAAIENSTSYSEVSERLGISRKRVARVASRFELDTSHMMRCADRPFDVETLLVKGDKRRNNTVRKIVLDLGLIEYLCGSCGQHPWWNDQELVLQLEHKDGDPTNNEISNLCFLCPNCHTQTPTYCGKKTRKRGNVS